MDEKKLKKLIETETEDIQVPDSLQPDAIEKKLMEQKQKKRSVLYKKAAAAAACCLVAAGVGIAGVRMSGSSQDAADTAGTAESAVEAKESAEPEAENIVAIASAEDYDQIYEMIEEQQKKYNYSNARAYGIEEATESMAVTEDSATGTGAASEKSMEFSDTNVREEGVGEADIIKTDGKHMFILKRDKIQIVGIESEEMEQLGTIELESESYYAEMYVKGDRVVAFYTQDSFEEPDAAAKSVDGGIYTQNAVAEIFDISDINNPERIAKITQSGNYNTVRLVGDYVYLFSNFYADISLGKEGISTYIPKVQGESIASENIFLPTVVNGTSYTVISSFSLQNPEEKIDKKAVFGNDDFSYVTNENIYLCESLGNPEGSSVTQTCIRKLSFADGEISPVGQTKVDGMLNNSFSIDEYNGNVRLVTTVTPVYGNVMPLVEELESFATADAAEEAAAESSSEEESEIYNTLYILDADLEELSRIDDIAPDEDVYSARFMGETGYFVTYEQIDPLFSVDLSDPENPEIIGELKIPGFSEYLHPYGEGLLLGIGMDVDETGTVTNGVKVSMFDISDPSDVQEIEKYVIDEAYATDVGYNYKAVLADAQKNLIGFLAYCDNGAEYYVFSYGEEGFTCEFEKDMVGYNSNVRGIYVGDRFYIVTDSTVESFTLDSFDKIDDLVL